MKTEDSQTAQMNNLTCRQLPICSKFKTSIALIGLLLAITGCMKSTSVTTNAGGHQIRAEIVGNHSIDSQPDQGTISSPFGKITIERTRAKFDDAPWTAIPENVPVRVSIAKGKLWLAAGPVTIKRTIR
jgi:hypothetical protein